MSTRGTIARTDGNGFKGVYHHWDSYPKWLGKTLFNLYNGFFEKDLEKMLKTLIDEHPAGWSTINDTDFSLTPGFGNDDGKQPKCYCHGTRSERANVITNKNASRCGVEYAYIFDVENKTMSVASSYSDYGKMIGIAGSGDPDAKWKIIATVELDGDEPNWEKMTEEEEVVV